MRVLALAALVACSGAPEAPPPPSAPAPETPPPLPELALLEKGPPQSPGPWARAYQKLAEAAGVGVVRCPLSGGGKAHQRYGHPRDLAEAVGPLALLDVEPGQEPPWDPVFDVAVADDEWLSMLAVPGSTKTWVATVTRTLEIEYAPPAPGAVSYCTSVKAIGPRTVRGSVSGLDPSTPVFPIACRTGIPPVGADGTFVVDLPPPCTMWVEGGVLRSEKVRVDPGEAPFEVKLTLGTDPLVNPDGSYNDAGRAAVTSLVAQLRERQTRTLSLLDSVGAAFAEDPAATKAVGAWRYEAKEWGLLIDHVANALDDQVRRIERDRGKAKAKAKAQ